MTCRPQDSRTSGRHLAPHPAGGPREVGRHGRPKPSALRAQRLRKEGARLVPRTPPPPPPCAWVQLRWAGASPPALAALSAVRTPGSRSVGLSWGQGQSLTRSGRRSGRGLSPWKRPPPQGYSDLRPCPRARRALRPPTVEFGALLTQRAAGHLAAPSCCPVRGDPLASAGDCSLVYSEPGGPPGPRAGVPRLRSCS